MGKPTIIIQARMGSSRLPGKIFMPLPFGGKTTVLEQVYRRAAKVSGAEQVVIATTENGKDDIAAEWAESNNYLYYRGSEDDVLDRFYRAAMKYDACPVIRITADCPFIDSLLISDMLKVYTQSDADYMSNTYERTFPHGLDTEIFSFRSLKRAWEEAKLPPYREHVTPYMYMSGLFKCKNYKNEGAAPEEAKIRITLDTREDYIVLCAVCALLGEDFTHKELAALFKTHGWLMMINEKIVQKKLYNNTEEEIADAVNLLLRQDMPNAAKKLMGS